MVAKGIDMEALSPRDANVRRPPASEFKVAVTNKATAALKPNKEKDQHPVPPPPNVTEPPSTDRREGAVYQVGKLLGKGGFAICYEGKLAGTSKRYALKIVKSKMPLKMEQKVTHSHHPCQTQDAVTDTLYYSSKPNCRSTPR